MDVIDYVVIALGLEMAIYFQYKCYEKLSDNKFQLNTIGKVLCTILTICLMTINTYCNLSFSMLLISFLLTLFSNYVIFRDSFKECLFRSLVFFIVMAIAEIIFSFVIFLLPSYSSIIEFDNSSIYKVFLSTCVYVLTYLFVSLNFVRRFSNMLIHKIKDGLLIFVSLIISLIYLLILVFKYKSNFTYSYNYFDNIFLLVCLILLLFVIFYIKHKSDLVKHKHEVLLDFMSNYEKLIDEHRVKLHEVHNDLIVLKSYKNKNSKNYDIVLNDFINKYKKSGTSYKNIYKLPSGLKGMLYYKIYDMKSSGIDVQIILSNVVMESIEKIVNKDFVLITKALGILLDNANDASIKSKNKYVIIEFYRENDNLIIRIENSCDSNKIDFSKIYNKGYSSKTSSSGYGLFILKSLISKSSNITFNQFLENGNFVSILNINIKEK
ncbi:MAG: GHKL domain-containing protein [Bacilli bacterium]|nr:GHKL domain-containing protein [Bacilli bacterium]